MPDQPTNPVPDDVVASLSEQRVATAALSLATVFWGCGFTWAKGGAEAIEGALSLSKAASFAPIFLLAWRFLLGGMIWMMLFPRSRQGWTWRGVFNAVILGAILAAGLIIQHLGLGLTKAAVSAFLTSLTILFVPILMTLVLRRPPRPVLWVGVVLATVGVFLMTWATPSGFGLGEVLGLLCSFGFALYILAVNAILPAESPWRMTGGQFLVVAAICFMICGLLEPRFVRPITMMHVLALPGVWINLSLLAVFTTLGAFGLLTHFQPRLDATRAALIYLIEPVVAALYAAIAVGDRLVARAIAGASLILVANILVELIQARQKKLQPPLVVD